MDLEQLDNSSDRGLIPHSDRGVQYCSNEYLKLLEGGNISISMTQSGDPIKNAVAEQVNGILKTEFLAHMCIPEKLDKAQQVLADITHL